MSRPLQTLAISVLLFAPASAGCGPGTLGIRIGEPPPPPAYRVPPPPGPDYDWIEGYWYPQGSQYMWHDGYWTRPPYVGAYWVAPYHAGGEYYAGHWEGHRGNVAHDHRWDRDQRRDERRR